MDFSRKSIIMFYNISGDHVNEFNKERKFKMRKVFIGGMLAAAICMCSGYVYAAADYAFDETFGNYEITEHDWHSGASKVMPEIEDGGGDSYLKYSSNGRTCGAYERIDEIDCTDAKIGIEADIRFAPEGTAGNSQFTIGDGSPKFDSGEIDYGYATGDPVSDGHIIAFEYNGGKTFMVNKKEISTEFIGDWFHVSAVVDFGTGKVDIVLTNEAGLTAEVNDLDFYSGNDINSIGSYYVRAAKPNGTVSVDDIRITNDLWTEDERPERLIISDEDNNGLESLTAGHSYTVGNLLAVFADGTEESVSDFSIDTSDDTVASVSGKTITANSSGSVTITFGYKGRTLEKQLEIASFIPEIKPDKAAFMTNTGESVKINVETDNNTDILMFESSNEKVAKVDKDGVVTAVGKGDAVITITAVNEKTNDRSEEICRVSVDYTGQNPIIPPSWGLYMADGEVYEVDGVAYMYGSRDYPGGYGPDGSRGWCSQDYHVIYSTDLINWTDAGEVLSIDDIPPYSEKDGYRLWAPDMFRGADGKFYLVSCTEWDIRKLYISDSDSPTGPFTNTRRIEVSGSSSGITAIDPGLLVDDDGTVYLATSNKDIYVLNPEKGYAEAHSRMQLPILDSFSDTLKYVEGPSLKKRGDKYYYIFIASPSSGKSTPMYMEYLYTKDITDPESWQYGGTVISTYGFLDAANIHGSIFEFDGEWYVAYHRLAPGFSEYTRAAALEKLEFDDEGRIIEAKRTSSGVKGAFESGERIQAASAVEFSGGMGDNRLAAGEEQTPSGYAYTYFDKPGQYIGYRYVDTESGSSCVTVYVKTTGSGAVLAMKNSPEGTAAALMQLPDTNGEWMKIAQEYENISDGRQEIYFELVNEPEQGMVQMDSFIIDTTAEESAECSIETESDGNDIRISLRNNSGTDRVGDVITTFYKNDEIVNIVISGSVELKADEDTLIKCGLLPECDEMKVFIWNSADDMQPLFNDGVYNCKLK